MPRYAVLLDLDDPELRPIALVTEHADAVRVHFAVDCGLRTVYREPYEVREPDGEAVRYEPGTPEYFNSVINTLSRGFVVNELDAAPRLNARTIAELYVSRVSMPRARRHAEYVTHALGASAYYVPEERGQSKPAVVAADPSQLASAA